MHAPLNRNEVQPPVVLDDVEELLGLSEGEDWAPLETEGEDENVMEEWESDEEVLASEGSGEEEDAHVIGSDDEGDLIYASFLDSFRDRHADETEGDFISFTDPTDMHPGDRFQDKSTCEYEHIAGSSCEVKRGYNGHQIRAEEMFACKTVQCLAHKANHWQPEPDDPEFEQDSRYFLSGLADYMPSRDWNRPHFVPLRNGLETADADVHDYLDHPAAMPFHPWCFEIFIRLSRQRFGRVDVDGLMDWRDHQHGVADRLRTFERWGPRHTEPDAFDCIPRHEDVKRSQDQEWRHVRGCEYLAANPVLVPNLSEILHAAIEPGVDGQDGVFQLTERDMEMRDSNPSDLFLKLSSELRLGILEHLDGASIASLRLSSRAFRQLPQTLFYMLLRHEFPSLWEAAQNIEGDQSSYFWSRIRAREIAPYIDNRDDPAQRDFHDDIDQFRTAIREEMPEMYDDWLAAEPNYQTYLNAPPWPPSMPEQTRLRKGQTNWHRVYVSLNKELGKGELKGLKNRERIWKDVSRIVEKISECREEGHIP